jgi:predicted phosphodiesterase
MKNISIGDIHGSNKWKLLLFGTITPTLDEIDKTINQFDKIIFIGDYVDSFDKDNTAIIDNLLEIIDLKKKYKDKVVLLWGNHDVYYYTLNYKRDNVSGIRPEIVHELNQIFRSNYNLFQFAYQYKNYIWTHAGIHKGWWIHYVLPKISGKKNSRFQSHLEGGETIADILNLMWQFEDDALFMVSPRRIKNGWGERVGSPLWADKTEIYKKPLQINQVLGHTKQECIKTYTRYNNQIHFIDALNTDDKLLTLQIL